jgi:hypothetical protein
LLSETFGRVASQKATRPSCVYPLIGSTYSIFVFKGSPVMTTFVSLRKTLLMTSLLATSIVVPTFTWAQTAPVPVPARTPAPQAPATAEPERETEVVIVRGRFIPEPQRVTSEVANFLSAADLARTGDDNAAAALTRLTGLSVVSGRFVYVRGLGDRYSSALLNGSPLPSPEPLRRQVPLDLFPSNILSGATVQKTFSPNYPGEFGGGIIDLRTLRSPNEPFLTLKVGTGGNSVTTGADSLVHFGHRMDWTGFDTDLRALPNRVKQAVGTGKRINDNNFTPVELEEIGESFINSPLTVIQREKARLDFDGELVTPLILAISIWGWSGSLAIKVAPKPKRRCARTSLLTPLKLKASTGHPLGILLPMGLAARA